MDVNMQQVPAAVSAGEMLAPTPAVTPGRDKVSTSFLVKSKDGDLCTAIALILTGMTGDAAYPLPVPTLATLAASGDAFKAAVLANDGGKAAVARCFCSPDAFVKWLAAHHPHPTLPLKGSASSTRRYADPLCLLPFKGRTEKVGMVLLPLEVTRAQEPLPHGIKARDLEPCSAVGNRQLTTRRNNAPLP